VSGASTTLRAAWAARGTSSRARLNTLVEEGLLRREPYREPGQRARVEYRLTEKGLELFPAVVALMQWGDRWAADLDGPPVDITHRDCGEPVTVGMNLRRRPRAAERPRDPRRARRRGPSHRLDQHSTGRNPDHGVRRQSATRSPTASCRSRSTGPIASTPSTGTMGRELIEAFDRADADDDVRAVIVTGEGRGFCAGADLGGGGETFGSGAFQGDGDGIPRDTGGQVSLRIYASTKPVIAAINGPAVGVGITMTLPMDIRLVAEGAKIGFVFTRRGIVPEACSSWFLPRIVGISQAMEWAATGRVFSAEEALAGGLVRSVHPGGELLGAARGAGGGDRREHLAGVRGDDPPADVGRCWARRTRWRPTEPTRAACFFRGQSADAREGVTSFLEKRPASFPDRVSEGLPDLFPGDEEPAFS